MGNDELSRIAPWEDALSLALGNWRVRAYQSLNSTMSLASELIATDQPDSPILVLAKSQTQGRGRQGRVWYQPLQGLYLTIAFPVREVSKLTSLSLVVGCAIRRAVAELAGPVLLKWPNDIVSNTGEKIGGILVDVVGSSERHYVSIGVGINLRGEPSQAPNARSLFSLFGVEISPAQIAERLAVELERDWPKFLSDGFAVFRTEWLDHAYGLGLDYKVDLNSEIIEGKFTGISSIGALVLQTEHGPREILSGHVVEIGSNGPV